MRNSLFVCSVVMSLVAGETARGQFSGQGGGGFRQGMGGGAGGGFGQGQPSAGPDGFSGGADPFSPRSNQYGSPATRRGLEPQGGYEPPTSQRDPYSGLPTASPRYGSPGSEEPFSNGGLRNPFYRPHGAQPPSFGTPAARGSIYVGPSQAMTPEWRRIEGMVGQGGGGDAQRIIEQQLGRDRSLAGLMNAVSMMERAGADSSAYREYRQQALQTARRQMAGGAREPLPWLAAAKFSLEDNDDANFRQAVDELGERFPDDKNTYYFQGIAAVRDRDWARAEASLVRARELGVPEESIAQWLKVAIDKQRWVWEYAWIVLWVLVAWIAGLFLLYAAGRIMSWLTLRGLKRGLFADPSKSPRLLRSGYRLVILLAGLYYYISLPLLVVLSIAAPLALCYALLNVPFVSLWLIALVAIVSFGSVATALSGLKACFAPKDRVLPGRPIAKEENVKLWRVVEEVAHRVGTRTVDAIYLIPTADIAVFERGGFLKRLFDRGERVLVLGVGVLEGFSQQALRSALAHEYGHFQNRDTAGGDIALRVYRAMESFAEALVARGRIRVWHFAVHFLRFYYRVFSRLTFGASRLQEVMADRTAVMAYGPAALEEGLTHSLRRAVEFEYWSSVRLQDFVRGATPSAFWQSQERPPAAAFGEVERVVSELLNRETTDEDTHPSPRDRFAFAKSLGQSDPADAGGMVWDLLHQPERICQSACRELDQQLGEHAQMLKTLSQAKLHFLQEAIAQTPSCEAYETRELVHLAIGDIQAALGDLEKSLDRAPHGLEAQLGKANAWRAAKDYRRAADALSAAMKASDHARTAEAWFALGDCLARIKDFGEAEKAFAQSLQKEWSASAALAHGQTLIELERHEPAIAILTELIGKLPSSSEPYVERAAAFGRAGDRERRLKDLEKAASLPVSYPRAHRQYAQALLATPTRSGETVARALRHARAACATPLNLAESLPVLIDALEAAGERGEALRSIDRLVEILPENQRPAWLERAETLRARRNSLEAASAVEVGNTVWA